MFICHKYLINFSVLILFYETHQDCSHFFHSV